MTGNDALILAGSSYLLLRPVPLPRLFQPLATDIRRAKNEEWMELGRELEKDASGNQQRFWAKVNKCRRTKN